MHFPHTMLINPKKKEKSKVYRRMSLSGDLKRIISCIFLDKIKKNFNLAFIFGRHYLMLDPALGNRRQYSL